MKKLDSVELILLNGESYIVPQEDILDILFQDITKDIYMGDKGLIKREKCESFHIEIMIDDEEENKDFIEDMVVNRELVSVALVYKSGKYNNIHLPFFNTDDESDMNLLQDAAVIPLKEIVEFKVEDTDKLLIIDVSDYNFDYDDEDIELELDE